MRVTGKNMHRFWHNIGGWLASFAVASSATTAFVTTALVATVLASAAAQAEVTATLDRQKVALGDSVRLIVTATQGEDLEQVDLTPLEVDFDILQRTSTSNTRIINGRRSETKNLTLDISARREGRLQIPRLMVGGQTTNPLSLQVIPAAKTPSDGQSVVFEAEVDHEQLYVQSQLLLTLRVSQAVNLERRTITELEIDNAFVKELDTKRFQRNIDGRQWLVHEIRYAIFPEKSGTLRIPSLVFSATARERNRGLFNPGGGRQLRRSSQPLDVNVLPRPENFPGSTWLPAKQITISERWSTPPDQLKVGESATRDVTIIGEGLQGAQLPPVLVPTMNGIKFYPDQPSIDEREIESGLLGTRRDSVAVVPTQAGTWTMPKFRISWWDTKSQKVRYAELPERKIVVAPATSASTPTSASAEETAGDISVAPPAETLRTTEPRWWRWIALFSSAGWLGTLCFFALQRRWGRSNRLTPVQESTSERRAFKALQQACEANDPAAARKALIEWANTVSKSGKITSLAQVAAQFSQAGESRDNVSNESAGLSAALADLERTLYSVANDACSTGHAWSGASLSAALDSARAHAKCRSKQSDETELTLYPTSVPSATAL